MACITHWGPRVSCNQASDQAQGPTERLQSHIVDVQRCYQRACKNRDSALISFPDTMLERTVTAMIADLRSKKIRRDRFSPFYLYPELLYAVTMLPTRAGVHITVASNPWNRPVNPVHLGELMKKYGGGGHLGVGGCNPPNQATAKQWAYEVYEVIRDVS